MNKYYTGIGSRNCPEWAYDVAFELGRRLAGYGYILRSGGAEGMDSAFENGCNYGKGKKEIYLPWKNFNENKSKLYELTDDGFILAEALHPAWHKLKSSVKRLMVRNTYQVSGANLDSPSNFIICYTPWHKGGTLQALRLAKELDIRVFNLIEYEASPEYLTNQEIIDEILKKVLIIKYDLRKQNRPEVATGSPHYCKLNEEIRYDDKCNHMSCEFCDEYYDNQTGIVNIKNSGYDVYIGRGSQFGNPFKIGVHGSRKQVIEKFREYFYSNEELQNEVLKLKGKILGCYCKPKSCHGDIYIEFLKENK